MSRAATALIQGRRPTPDLVEAAIHQARAKLGPGPLTALILVLGQEFLPHLDAALATATRAAGCLQVMGMTASGVCTEAGSVVDQPGVAALALGSTWAPDPGAAPPHLTLAAHATLPPAWLAGPPRFGLLHPQAAAWQAGRHQASDHSSLGFAGARCHLGLSAGFRSSGPVHGVAASQGYDLISLDGESAVASLRRALPPPLRDRQPLPIHHAALIRPHRDKEAIPLLSANANGSLTIAEALAPGEQVQWVLRQPLAAECDMRDSVADLAARCPTPDFGLFLSCIGRGPLFHGGEDRDLQALSQRFPGLPLLGAYGMAQIFPFADGNRQLHNAVVTALFEASHAV